MCGEWAWRGLLRAQGRRREAPDWPPAARRSAGLAVGSSDMGSSPVSGGAAKRVAGAKAPETIGRASTSGMGMPAAASRALVAPAVALADPEQEEPGGDAEEASEEADEVGKCC